MAKLEIFIAAHKPCEKFGDDAYRLLHVGAARHPDVHIDGAVKDDDGPDNISLKNDTYCELTALYHIWKNIHDVDYTGLCHYRRFFVRKDTIAKNPNDIILSQQEILTLLNDYDVIMATPTPKTYGTGGFITNPLDLPEQFFYRCILPSVKALYPEYADAYAQEFFIPKLSCFNMMICSKALFDQYCEWLFAILFDAEKRWNEWGIGVAPREMGYISEFLLNTWVRHQGLKVCRKPVYLIEDSNKLGFKVHYTLSKLGLGCLNPVADKVYGKLKGKKS